MSTDSAYPRLGDRLFAALTEEQKERIESRAMARFQGAFECESPWYELHRAVLKRVWRKSAKYAKAVTP